MPTAVVPSTTGTPEMSFARITPSASRSDCDGRTVTGFKGESVDALSLSSMSRELGEHIGVHFMIHDHDDLRGALKPDAKGRPPRGDLKAVRALMDNDSP